MCGGVLRLYPQLRCFTACSGFHIDVSLQNTAHLTHDTVYLTHAIAHLTPHPIRPPSGNMCGGVVRLYPQLRCSAACSGFHIDVSLQDTAHLTHDSVHLTHAIAISHLTLYVPLRGTCVVWCFTHMLTAALLRSLQWVSYRRVPSGHCAAHACHSASTHGTVHLTHDTAISHRTPYVPRRGTDYPKPTASCEAAPLWGIANLPSPHRFRVAGPTVRNPLQAAKQRRCGA